MRNRIQLLDMAQEKLAEAIMMIEAATKGDDNTKAYLVDQLKTFESKDHGFLCNNLTVECVATRYREDEFAMPEDVSDEVVEQFM